MPTHGQLRVWHIPQVPMDPFYVDVANALEARLVMDALANYDLFQLEHNIKPDYSNVSGLVVFDASDTNDGPDGSWVEWYDADARSIDDHTLDDLRALAAIDLLPTCDEESL